jgi:hypothetical protein
MAHDSTFNKNIYSKYKKIKVFIKLLQVCFMIVKVEFVVDLKGNF